ncbi:hypothetical protein [Bellilinea sp.]|uniref:hypothetical protein n=1 Tax=Bellilinea sp. TaxID=2838785 RepID=UPI002ADE0FAE|nr:hypothetical protein [Bellilinea sp.]
MNIEATFRDLKGLLGMSRLMNKRQESMEKMVAVWLLVYAITLLIGEGLRDHLYGQPSQPQGSTNVIPNTIGRKWQRYSDLFILLK